MNVISLDVSTKPGFAVYLDRKLVRYGTMFADKKVEEFGPYPFSYILLAKHTAQRLFKEVVEPVLAKVTGPVFIVLEETTASSEAYSQKKLEFIHFALIEAFKDLKNVSVFYVRDGAWKNKVGARQNADEKKLNAKIAAYKKKTGEKLAKLDLDGTGKAKVVGKLGPKHYAIRALKEKLNISLDMKHEDAADAILIGYAFIVGVPLCDGTPFGGMGSPGGYKAVKNQEAKAKVTK